MLLSSFQIEGGMPLRRMVQWSGSSLSASLARIIVFGLCQNSLLAHGPRVAGGSRGLDRLDIAAEGRGGSTRRRKAVEGSTAWFVGRVEPCWPPAALGAAHAALQVKWLPQLGCPARGVRPEDTACPVLVL